MLGQKHLKTTKTNKFKARVNASQNADTIKRV